MCNTSSWLPNPDLSGTTFFLRNYMKIIHQPHIQHNSYQCTVLYVSEGICLNSAKVETFFGVFKHNVKKMSYRQKNKDIFDRLERKMYKIYKFHY